MARVIEQAVKKTRYISVRLAGEEVYVENISSEGDQGGVYLTNISQIAAGSNHSMALQSGGDQKHWILSGVIK